MKRILCPTDFSDMAYNAIAYAAKFAQATQSELVLFNVQSVFSLNPAELLRGESESLAMVKEQLEAQCREVAQMFKISCYSEVQLSGVPLTRVISDNAADFDLIIMGTNGEEDLYQFFAGSNTYNVIRKAAVPVLLIPVDCTYADFSLVVYAFNYLKEGKLPFDQLSQWLRLTNCELRVLEVLEVSESKRVDRELHALQKFIRETIPADQALSFDTVHSSDTIDSINRYVLEQKADMLALCTQHHSMWGRIFHKSVIKAISIMARYPVFVFHH